MTTQQRPTTHEERSEWVVDAATGRIIRREAARRLHLAGAVGGTMRRAAMNIEPGESEGVVWAVEDSRSEKSEASEARQRSEVRTRPDGKALNRQHWDE